MAAKVSPAGTLGNGAVTTLTGEDGVGCIGGLGTDGRTEKGAADRRPAVFTARMRTRRHRSASQGQASARRRRPRRQTNDVANRLTWPWEHDRPAESMDQKISRTRAPAPAGSRGRAAGRGSGRCLRVRREPQTSRPDPGAPEDDRHVAIVVVDAAVIRAARMVPHVDEGPSGAQSDEGSGARRTRCGTPRSPRSRGGLAEHLAMGVHRLHEARREKRADGSSSTALS